MAWLLLIIAILFEIAGTTCMKLSDGFTKFVPSVAMGVFYLCGLALLAMVLKKIDVSIAYAVWSGLGTMLIALIGMVYFREPIGAIKIASIFLIVLGVVGLNISGATAEREKKSGAGSADSEKNNSKPQNLHLTAK